MKNDWIVEHTIERLEEIKAQLDKMQEIDTDATSVSTIREMFHSVSSAASDLKYESRLAAGYLGLVIDDMRRVLLPADVSLAPVREAV